ncbi:hypothetical protein FRB90_002809 [Tulasnella sp. 427]|nr:hypothetical protein FRB90_002809 [Tulasnella sp. 427]
MTSPASSQHDDAHSTVIETEDTSDESSPGTKLKAQLQRLQDWRIDQRQIRLPQGDDACEFVGGHATVTRALMERFIEYVDPSEIEEEENEENGGEERQEEWAERQEVHHEKSISAGWIHIEKLETAVAVKKHKIGDNKDLKKSQRVRRIM